SMRLDRSDVTTSSQRSVTRLMLGTPTVAPPGARVGAGAAGMGSSVAVADGVAADDGFHAASPRARVPWSRTTGAGTGRSDAVVPESLALRRCASPTDAA